MSDKDKSNKNNKNEFDIDKLNRQSLNTKRVRVQNEKKMHILLPTHRIEPSLRYQNANQVQKVFRNIMDYDKYAYKWSEHAWVMAIDEQGYISCVYLAAIGQNNVVNVDLINIFSTAINYKSKKIILAHNHPSSYDEITMSHFDFTFTNRIYHGAKLIGLELIDHIILGEKVYFSLEENNLMKIIRNSDAFTPRIELEEKILKEKIKFGAKRFKKGIKKGKIEIAQSMLKDNINVEIIMKHTGLTTKDIENIINSS